MNLPDPITRREQYLSRAAGQGTKIPETPITREEQYLEALARHGGGTSDYTDLINKPAIEGVELSGNKTLAQLGAASAEETGDLSELVTTDKSSLVGAVNEVNERTTTGTTADITAIINGTWEDNEL